MMMFMSLALALTAANAQDSESHWKNTVDSDKTDLSMAISNMESVAHDYRKASQNRSHAARVSLNLAEKAFNNARDDAQKDKQNAMADFNNALDDLQTSSATGNWRDAEKDARQKSAKVDKVYRQEKEDAMQRLKVHRAHESKKISESYDQARHAANKLLRDKNNLKRAMRHNGRSEREYEAMVEKLEQHAERLRDYAEDNRDRASDAVEHVFEHAQDHLNDREQQVHDRSIDERERAIEEAVSSLRRQQAAQASPVASALNLYAKTADADSKSHKKEQDAQYAVDSDKSRLSSSMQHLDRAVSSLRRSANKTHVQAVAVNIAKGAFDEAAKNAMAEKEHAVKDFNKYLEDLKSASPTSKWSHALKTVREQARYLDKLDHKENADARKRLRRKHHLQNKEVKKSYHSAHRASHDMLRDKDHLESAMRRAGAKESEYEGQEMTNEALGERYEDQSSDLNDDAHDATDEIYEKAHDNLDALQHANRKQQHDASRYRHEQIHDAEMTLKYAREGKTYTKKASLRGDADDDDSENQLQNIQEQMEKLSKGIPGIQQELIASPLDFSSLCLLAVASFLVSGLLISFYARRTRPSAVARGPPLLG